VSETKVVDLRQASVNEMLRHLGELVEAIKRSNERYVRQERELGEINAKLHALTLQSHALTLKVEEGFRDVRSDLVLMENRLLTAEHKASRAALTPPGAIDDQA
jgi:hypothetical protein